MFLEFLHTKRPNHFQFFQRVFSFFLISPLIRRRIWFYFLCSWWTSKYFFFLLRTWSMNLSEKKKKTFGMKFTFLAFAAKPFYMLSLRMILYYIGLLGCMDIRFGFSILELIIFKQWISYFQNTLIFLFLGKVLPNTLKGTFLTCSIVSLGRLDISIVRFQQNWFF